MENAGLVGGADEHRLIVELPGITDVQQAVDLIGKTPILEFKLVKDGVDKLTPEQQSKMTTDQLFTTTGLTGRYLKKATPRIRPDHVRSPRRP